MILDLKIFFRLLHLNLLDCLQFFPFFSAIFGKLIINEEYSKLVVFVSKNTFSFLFKRKKEFWYPKNRKSDTGKMKILKGFLLTNILKMLDFLIL